jgi:predicted metalloprotease with PDZ domain
VTLARALLALLLVAAAPAPEPAPVDYLVTPEIGADGLERIRVTIRLRGDADGETGLALPSRWAGSDRLYERLERLSVSGGAVAEADDPARRLIRHAPGAALSVSYRIGLSEADPDAGYEKARPVVRPGWFYVHGEGAFAVPEGRSDAPARFRMAVAPAGWRWTSNIDLRPGRSLTVDNVVESILIGGTDLRIVTRSVGGQPLRIALRGRWTFADAAMADGLARIAAAYNDYMQAPAAPYFVSLVPLGGAETGAISFGGSGRGGGFALASTTNVGLDDFLPTLAHEYGHRWFGRGLGPIPDPDGPDYWFTEGFNDHVAGLALVRAGIWGPAQYAERLNSVLLRYASSPARTLANGTLAERFWTDPYAQQMPYDRGHLFARSLDQGDTLRRALLTMAADRGFPEQETQGPRFVRAAALPPDQADAMLRGEPIALPADLLAPCGPIEWAEQPIYATGYTVAERAGTRYFERVEENSPAWQAGLRPGMRYVRRVSFRPGDSRAPIVMRIADAQGEREISWRPEGPTMVRFQRLVLAPDAGEGCRARLVGN